MGYSACLTKLNKGIPQQINSLAQDLLCKKYYKPVRFTMVAVEASRQE